LAKILIWFDNEWAYASRMVDVALAWQQRIAESTPPLMGSAAQDDMR
jgi:hypothetical protein